MREFCEGGKPIISSIKQFSDRTESAVCEIKGHSLSSSVMIQTIYCVTPPAMADCEIKFCPMCGRKLVEK